MNEIKKTLAMLYGAENAAGQMGRYKALGDWFHALYPGREGMRFFSAPGRAEVGGNHTDHQSGRVLAASVHLDTVAAVAKNGTMTARIHSQGFPMTEVDFSHLAPKEGEQGTPAAFLRGCAAGLARRGYPIGGFDGAVVSDVLSGSGLSSSAAFGVLACAILGGLFAGGILPPSEAAHIAKEAENDYFGKPSGLLDQMASALGGMSAMDFEKEEPQVTAIPYDFTQKGYTMAVVNTFGSHDDLTDAYAAIPREMGEVAAYFGEKRLRTVCPDGFYAAIPALRGKVSDRAILRAMHFFQENARVPRMAAALQQDDLPAFFEEVAASGDSSWRLLQNLYADPKVQPLALALALSERMLGGLGAYRIHGGGFAGTILAFVPHGLEGAYREGMDALFGKGAYTPLGVRPVGAYEIMITS